MKVVHNRFPVGQISELLHVIKKKTSRTELPIVSNENIFISHICENIFSSLGIRLFFSLHICHSSQSLSVFGCFLFYCNFCHYPWVSSRHPSSIPVRISFTIAVIATATAIAPPPPPPRAPSQSRSHSKSQSQSPIAVPISIPNPAPVS